MEKAKNPFQTAEVQLCKLETAIPKGDWIFELKYDGYRMLAFVEGGKAALFSRNGKDYTDHFRPVADSLAALFFGRAFVLDGEIVVTDNDGKTDFQALQNYLKNPSGKNLSYIVFDLLALDGKDLRSEPLLKRKEKLEELLRGAPKNIRYSAHTYSLTDENFEAVCRGKYEGLIAKKVDSIYSGTRNGDWIKLKCAVGQEFVVGGFSRSGKKSEGLSSLLLGYFEGGRLVYAGRAGTGFSEKTASELQKKLEKIKVGESPFSGTVKQKKDETVVFTKPKLSAQIRFADWTEEGLLRHASFQGLREDKEAKEIVREQISNPDKQMFSGISKQKVAEYYEAVAERMMPYIENRILSLVRCPGGVSAPCFYKKHPAGAGKGLKVVSVKNSEGETDEYFCITEKAGILTEVQMNTLEFHTWGSRAENIYKPDIMVFDLDPDEGMTLDRVREGVSDTKSVLDGLGLKSYLKTSGGKGYHIVVPFAPSADWDTFKNFAKKVAEFMERKWQEKYTSNVRKVNRKGRIFIDWIRNGRGATSVAPYSIRAREGARVSMPILWEELDKIAPDGITTDEAVKRLSAPDPWQDFFKTMKNQKLK